MYGVILFLFIALLAEILGTIAGFGSSTFFVPLAGFFFTLKTVLALTGILHVFSNIAKLIFFRRSIDMKLILWIGIPSIIMVIVGAQLNSQVQLFYAEFILGMFLMTFSALMLFRPEFKLLPNKTNSVTTGSIAGFLAGMIGTGGAVRGMGLAAFNLEKGAYVATSAAIDLGVDMSRSVIYVANGYLTREYFFYIPLLIGIAFFGSWVGKKWLQHISQKTFKRVVLILLFLTGVTQVIKTLAG